MLSHLLTERRMIGVVVPMSSEKDQWVRFDDKLHKRLSAMGSFCPDLLEVGVFFGQPFGERTEVPFLIIPPPRAQKGNPSPPRGG